jgi:menaquinone-specific isochorismate synthase
VGVNWSNGLAESGIDRSELESALTIVQSQLNPDLPELPVIIENEIDDEIDLLDWLRLQRGFPKVFWCSRDGSIEIAGIGALMSVDARSRQDLAECLDRVERILNACPEVPVRLIGGISFGKRHEGDRVWSRFPFAQYIIPRMAIVKQSGRSFRVAGVAVGSDTSVTDAMRSLSSICESSPQVAYTQYGTIDATVNSRSDTPGLDVWREQVSHVTSEIDDGVYDKVVLARRTDISVDEHFDAIRFLTELRCDSRNTFSFLFQPAESHAFLSLTPERLVSYLNGVLHCDALAGTVRKGEDDIQSRVRAEELLSSAKDRREHSFVEEDVRRKLEVLCGGQIEQEELSILELSNVLHLRSAFSGRSSERPTLSRLISSFHPTPAVGGCPWDRASRVIERYESFDRGWFAGPIGLVSRNIIDIAVGIRSAVISKDLLSIFAGAGIVAGSQPSAEWQELEYKISPLLRSLGGVLV